MSLPKEKLTDLLNYFDDNLKTEYSVIGEVISKKENYIYVKQKAFAFYFYIFKFMI